MKKNMKRGGRNHKGVPALLMKAKAKNVNASYVSPMQYQGYNCNQIGQELLRVNRQVLEVTGQQDKAANKDAVALGVGLVLFWPALFFMIGGDKKEELAKLKGRRRIYFAKNNYAAGVLEGIDNYNFLTNGEILEYD